MKKKKANILTLGVPIFIQLLLFNFLSTIDTLMITDYNESLVIAINNAGQVTSMLNVLFSICSTGVGIVIAQYLGAGKEEDAKKSFNNGFLFNLILSLFLMIILLFLQKPLLQLINCPEHFIPDAMQYLSITCFGMPLYAMTYVLSANLRSYQRPGFITVIGVGSNLINVGLNYLLIYGKFGLPEMGIQGAAIATVISQGITFVLSLICTPFILKSRVYSLRFSWSHLKKIIFIGFPSALESICYTVSGLFVTRVVNQLSEPEILARTYINMIMSYIYQFSVAFGQANSILVGHDVGKERYAEAKRNTYSSYLICFPILFMLIILLNLFGEDLIYLIVRNAKVYDPEEIVSAAVLILPWMFLYETGRCVNLIFINSLKAAGDVLFPLIGAIVCMFLFSSFGSWLLGIHFQMGFLGIFLAQALDECARAVLMIARWQSNKWMNRSIVRTKEGAR